MLVTDIRHEFVATRRLRLDGLAPAALEALFADFVAEGEARLTRDGVPLADRRMLRSADLRYHGQSFELPVTVPPGALSAADVARLRDEFHAMHERAYGYAAPEDPVELVNVRLAAVGVTPKPRRAPLPEGGPAATPALKGRRDVWFAEAGGFRPTLVLDRGKLLRGNVIDGPRDHRGARREHARAPRLDRHRRRAREPRAPPRGTLRRSTMPVSLVTGNQHRHRPRHRAAPRAPRPPGGRHYAQPRQGGPLRGAAAAEKLPLERRRARRHAPGSVDRAVGATLARDGPIDVLVNNAGIGGATPLELTPEAEHRACSRRTTAARSA